MHPLFNITLQLISCHLGYGDGNWVGIWVMCLSSSIRLAWASSHGRQRLPRAAWQSNCQILLASHCPKQITRPTQRQCDKILTKEWIKRSVSTWGYYYKQYTTPCWLVFLSPSSISLWEHEQIGTHVTFPLSHAKHSTLYVLLRTFIFFT